MMFLKKITGKIKTAAALRLLRWAARTDRPGLAASVMTRVAWRVPERPRTRAPGVLCLGRTIFNDDIKALAKYSGRLEYIVVHLQYFEQIFQPFFTKHQLAAMSELNYHVDRATASSKQRLANFWRRLLPLLQKHMGIAAVMTGNFAYVVQQELQAVCAEQGLPFFVLHKEGFVGFGGADYGRDYVAGYKNTPFTGTKIFFYNETAKASFLDAGIPGFTEDKMEVVGVPRLDAYFAAEPFAPAERQIAFFSFYVKDRFHYLENNPELTEQIAKRAADFHRWVMELAARHPEIRVVIKTKSAGQYLEYVQNIRHDAGADGLANLVITNAASVESLIKNSQVILGSNSTTLVEALIAGKPIVAADFSDLLPERSQDFLRGYPDLVNTAHSSADLERLAAGGEAKFSVSRLQEFLREFIFRFDGQASQRVEQGILSELDSNH